VLTVGQPRPNVSGSLLEGIAVWAERVASLTAGDVQSRVRQVLRWQLACGVQHVRSHVDVCDPKLTALRALVDLREEARGLIDLQLVAFPQQGILGFDGGRELMAKAVELGADRGQGLSGFPLVTGFADANNGQKTGTLRRLSLRPHSTISFPMIVTALGMADNDRGRAGVFEHFRRDIAGEGSGPLRMTILAADRHATPSRRSSKLCDQGGRRTHH